MAKRMKTPTESQAKWQRRVSQAGQDYQTGVQNATGWADAAVSASARRDAGLQAAMADGRINAGIQRTGDAGWKSKTLAKGPAAWSAGVQNGGAAYLAGANKNAQYQAAAQAATANIDTSTLAGRLQKAQVWAQTVAAQAAQAKASGG